MEDIIVTSISPKQPNHPNKSFDKNLYDCPDCKGFGTKLKSCHPLANEVGKGLGKFWIPYWVYGKCSTCNGTGKVEDLTPDYLMD